VGTEVLSLDLEAEGQEAELGLDLNIHGLNFGSTVGTRTGGLLSSEFLLFLFENVHEPHFSPATTTTTTRVCLWDSGSKGTSKSRICIS